MRVELQNPLTAEDHIRGPETAPLELVEYGDYQCPSCGESYLVLKRVQQQLGKQVKYIFRNFPLTEHPDAFSAAMAAEAAALQHKFWEMYDLLYSNQLYLGSNDLLGYASEIGLDINKFRRDTQSEVLASKIQADLDGGEQSGVTGTPNFYINGEKYDGDWEGDGLIHYLKRLL
ncbi:DsbA family protein [Mucilaginibacter lappiensis]|uniref:Protein-disulfide isomerase n=1 Tax=Mucilaginibacter lappiensis TaxID=354630 RepID=A0A1N7GEB9_9SPHI|nr:thioredoxin domain-containing protein [Mucilaginibacter lappiensis]MBB6113055.1 protein-disulfide isomerase [Mucilaginibacter lappiensis]MBB6130709.1 protein-disulfide isomerase [Mucilaginibacter lappiensis]SIS10914.1 Thioredoxin [Mucilaginibacter lappiensis]